ncbi:MAG: hypothetical protein ACYSVY_16460, partial [Planctomycetota bacterium]
ACKEHPGPRPVYLEVPNGDGFVATIRCGRELGVEIGEPLLAAITDVLGRERVTLRGLTRRAIPVQSPASAGNRRGRPSDQAPVEKAQQPASVSAQT